MNNIFQQQINQPNYLWGKPNIPVIIDGSSSGRGIPVKGYLVISDMMIPFDKTPNKFQFILFKLLKFKWKDVDKLMTEEEEINNRRKQVLDDILQKKYFWRFGM